MKKEQVYPAVQTLMNSIFDARNGKNIAADIETAVKKFQQTMSAPKTSGRK